MDDTTKVAAVEAAAPATLSSMPVLRRKSRALQFLPCKENTSRGWRRNDWRKARRAAVVLKLIKPGWQPFPTALQSPYGAARYVRRSFRHRMKPPLTRPSEPAPIKRKGIFEAGKRLFSNMVRRFRGRGG